MKLENIKNMDDANKWYNEEYEKLETMDASDEIKSILLHQLNGTYSNMKNWFNK